MSVYDNEDIVGAYVGGKVVCVDCLTDAEDTELEEKDIITAKDIEDPERSYFCDRCGKKL